MTLEHDLATKVGEVDFGSFDADCLVWVIPTELLCPSPEVLFERSPSRARWPGLSPCFGDRVREQSSSDLKSYQRDPSDRL